MTAIADPVFGTALRAAVSGRPAVLASIVGVRGSSPREVGARMLVTARRIAGTVGGGVLEHMAIQRGRAMLRDADARPSLLSFPLGPDSQQCCGGVVTLFLQPLANADGAWLRRLTPEKLSAGVGLVTDLGGNTSLIDSGSPAAALPPAARRWFDRADAGSAALFADDERELVCQYLAQPGFEVALFGAGHVGRAIAAALAAHRCRVLWIDSREREFPDPLPVNARALVSEDVAVAMQQVRPGAMVLVLTHRHPLDYEICRLALRRNDFAFLGLIGSVTKRRRFARALIGEDIDARRIERLCCPIGIAQLKSKEPQVIAASVVAQLLTVSEAARQTAGSAAGIAARVAERSGFAEVF